MSDTVHTSDPDGAIYPDGSPAPADGADPTSPDVRAVGEGGPEVMNPEDSPFWTPSTDPQPSPEASQPPSPNPPTTQVDGEMLIANLLVEIANLTKRAIMAETMVQMYRQAAQPSQPKPAQ